MSLWIQHSPLIPNNSCTRDAFPLASKKGIIHSRLKEPIIVKLGCISEVKYSLIACHILNGLTHFLMHIYSHKDYPLASRLSGFHLSDRMAFVIDSLPTTIITHIPHQRSIIVGIAHPHMFRSSSSSKPFIPYP